jgi:hypothetical protein
LRTLWGAVAVGMFVALAAPAACQADVPLLNDYLEACEIPPDTTARVYRMDFDVTNDGQAELFLGSSYLAGAFGQTWTVYTPTSDGKYRRLGTLVFRYDALYYSHEEAKFVIYVRVSSSIGAITKFAVSPLGFEELSEPYSLEAEQLKMDTWSKTRSGPYWIELNELRNAQAPVWRDIKDDKVQPSLGKLEGVVVP